MIWKHLTKRDKPNLSIWLFGFSMACVGAQQAVGFIVLLAAAVAFDILTEQA